MGLLPKVNGPEVKEILCAMHRIHSMRGETPSSFPDADNGPLQALLRSVSSFTLTDIPADFCTLKGHGCQVALRNIAPSITRERDITALVRKTGSRPWAETEDSREDRRDAARCEACARDEEAWM